MRIADVADWGLQIFKTMKTAIIYHDADFDGKLSRDVCLYQLGRRAPVLLHAYGWDYGRPLPGCELKHEDGRDAWENYDRIYIVDLSVDELMKRPELRFKITWIDHHRSAMEKWDTTDAPRFEGLRIDGVAACRLCWNWFTANGYGTRESNGYGTREDFVERRVAEPRLLRMAGEYDVWDLRDPDVKALQFGLRALSEEKLGELVWDQFLMGKYGMGFLDDAIDQGRAIQAYCNRQNDEYARGNAHTVRWEGLTWCALNLGQRGNSDLLAAAVRPEHDGCLAWRYDGAQVSVSLYGVPHRREIDLSVIAVKHGGGGHRGACGFRTTLGHMEEILGGK